MSSKDDRKICFVVMGFGVKTDYESGKTFDLDATYTGIIKPTIDEIGYRCVRADEIPHSGIIDAPMYDMLLRSDLVIADITTGNANAIYELGVRHAMRSKSTIVMQEQKGRFHFDLNHINTFKYEHLGPDIGYKEVMRARLALSALVKKIVEEDTPDSPVYTYLPRLKQPSLTDEEFADLVDETEAAQEILSGYISKGRLAMSESRMDDAARAFKAASVLRPADPYIVQQLALATYKSKQPSELQALVDATVEIAKLNPDESNDPETLGISGAICKNLWFYSKDAEQLNRAIMFYRRGYEIRRDYYTGENYAFCVDLRSAVQVDEAERIYDKTTAKKVRQSIIEHLLDIVKTPSFPERSDRMWIFATLANCYLGIDDAENAKIYEDKFLSEGPAGWQNDTYNKSKLHTLEYCLGLSRGDSVKCTVL